MSVRGTAPHAVQNLSAIGTAQNAKSMYSTEESRPDSFICYTENHRNILKCEELLHLIYNVELQDRLPVAGTDSPAVLYEITGTCND